MKLPYLSNKSHGFTFVELCVVIVTIGILAVMLMPALSQTKPKSRSVECLSNQKQIIMAAKMYADDNQDNWVPNFPGQTPNWVGGNMDFSKANTDNTNAAKMVNITYSILGSYVKNPAVYHCPGDSSTVPGEGYRVRSVSMNETVGTVGTTTGQLTAGSAVNGQWVTGNNIGNARQTTWATYGKTSSMINPVPAALWVFTDENPLSINDGAFAVEMQNTGVFAVIIDFPGSYHNGGCGFSFADGHAEIHQWIGNTIKSGGLGNALSGTPSGDSAVDIQWLQSHTSVHL